MGQGVALGGSWDRLASLLAINAPAGKRGWYAMIPQLGAPLGLIVASLRLFMFLISALPAQDFLDWGWRYPFFVAFAINVVALFAPAAHRRHARICRAVRGQVARTRAANETVRSNGKSS